MPERGMHVGTGGDTGRSLKVQKVAEVWPHSCPECGRKMSNRHMKESLWGMCKTCENERLGEVCAG